MSIQLPIDEVQRVLPGVTRLHELPPGTRQWEQLIPAEPFPVSTRHDDPAPYTLRMRQIALSQRYSVHGRDLWGAVDGDTFYYAWAR
jgi:hypothetical protein